jgi:cell division protein FtsW (lipid II flippase)
LIRRKWPLDAVLLPLLPVMTLLAGVGLVRSSGSNNLTGSPEMSFVLGVAVLGCVVIPLALHEFVPGFDLILVCVSAMLVSIGTSMQFLFAGAAGSDQSFFSTIVLRHTVFVGMGFAALVGGALFAHRVETIRTFPVTLLAFSFLLTAITIVFGQTINGARLWLQLGPMRFQPSEIARLLLAIFVAAYLFDRRHLVSAAWRVSRFDLPPIPYLIPLVGAVLSSVAVLVFQNDLGMAALLVLGAFATVAGINRSKATIGAAGAFLAVAAVVSFAVTPRVQDRVSGWLDPWRDAAISGFQLVQADYSLASGGVFGDGGAALTVTVPEIHTDFVFVGVANQFGWLGALAVLALAGVLVCRCILVALQASDGFRSLLAFSLAAVLGIQVVLIAGGTLRVLPLTGLTFPLLSYGGTSMIVTMFTLGIVAGLGASDGVREWD